jgi:hypothetical protein
MFRAMGPCLAFRKMAETRSAPLSRMAWAAFRRQALPRTEEAILVSPPKRSTSRALRPLLVFRKVAETRSALLLPLARAGVAIRRRLGQPRRGGAISVNPLERSSLAFRKAADTRPARRLWSCLGRPRRSCDGWCLIAGRRPSRSAPRSEFRPALCAHVWRSARWRIPDRRASSAWFGMGRWRSGGGWRRLAGGRSLG